MKLSIKLRNQEYKCPFNETEQDCICTRGFSWSLEDL